MSRHRRPLVAVLSMLALVVIQAVADPTGLLALVGWAGGAVRFDLGLWPIASTLIFTPVLLALVWWVAARVGSRFWLMTLGFTVAVLFAQAVAVLAMTGDLSIAGRAAGSVTAKAVPAALIVAALTRWLGGRTHDAVDAADGTGAAGGRDTVSAAADADTPRRRGEWASAAVFAGFTPLLAGAWWTGAPCRPGGRQRDLHRARRAPGRLVQRGDRTRHRVPAGHRPDVGVRRRAGVGHHHRRGAALPVHGARPLPGR